MNTDIAIALVFFIVGLIPAYYFYRKGIRVKEPVYYIESNNLISASLAKYQGLKVSYKNQKTENLTVTRIIFFNRGAEMINRDDIKTINPIRIVAENDVKLLDVSILLENNPSSQFATQLDRANNQAFLYFDYLSKNQGATIQVIHTGLSSDDIDVLGDIKDVTCVRRLARDTKLSNPFRKTFRMVSLIMMVVIPISSLALVIASNSPLFREGIKSVARSTGLFTIITAILIWMLFFYGFFSSLKGFAPMDLELDEEEVSKDKDKKRSP